jgi:hypothetical protein
LCRPNIHCYHQFLIFCICVSYAAPGTVSTDEGPVAGVVVSTDDEPGAGVAVSTDEVPGDVAVSTDDGQGDVVVSTDQEPRAGMSSA